MSPFSQALLLIISALAALSILGIFLELRQLRLSLTRRGLPVDVRRIHLPSRHGSNSMQPPPSPHGYAIFVFRENTWCLEEDHSAPGCRATPPTLEGAFEGQAIRVSSTPDPSQGPTD